MQNTDYLITLSLVQIFGIELDFPVFAVQNGDLICRRVHQNRTYKLRLISWLPGIIRIQALNAIKCYISSGHIASRDGCTVKGDLTDNTQTPLLKLIDKGLIEAWADVAKYCVVVAILSSLLLVTILLKFIVYLIHFLPFHWGRWERWRDKFGWLMCWLSVQYALQHWVNTRVTRSCHKESLQD